MSDEPGRTELKPAWAGPIYRRIGVDELRAARDLSDFEFRVWAHVRAGGQSREHGVQPCVLGHLAEDLELPVEQVREALASVVEQRGWTHDAEARWMFIPEALETAWDGASSSNLTGYRKQLAAAKAPAHLVALFEQQAARVLEAAAERRGLETPSERERREFVAAATARIAARDANRRG